MEHNAGKKSNFFHERPFVLKTLFPPCGDQRQAIPALVAGIQSGQRAQVLLGVTGSGKTYTMAQVIAQVGLPTLVLSHNKTLAAQLFSEMRGFFPENAVEYFVSYYDYYQPEAYVASTDTYIEKDAQINDELDKLRHSATRSLLERSDVVIVSSVSCIYGLGSPEAYQGLILYLEVGRLMKRQDFLRKLVEIQYTRNDSDFSRGIFRVRGDTVDIFPAYEEELAVRVSFFGDTIESLSLIDPLRGGKGQVLTRITIYPASHYVTSADVRKQALGSIRVELQERLQFLHEQGRIMEAERLEERTLHDCELIEEIGFCPGIENYSRHLTGRGPGEAPPTLLEYFPKKWLLIVDESHVTVPQIGAMYRGDRARKMNLVEHGFRLPSALDNRPLAFQEWENLVNQVIFVSATPADYELEQSGGQIVEQVIRPTGLLDPLIEVRSARTQVDNLLTEIYVRVKKKQRVLVTTLTKKLAEDLTDYYSKQGVRVKYLHSDIETLERIEILRDLRLGVFDVLVGINLLREGLDLPEVTLVAILDADKEGFLRSARSLIQTIGRAARNAEGFVLLYGDKITDSMRKAIDETQRRRVLQEAYNKEHGITPTTVSRALPEDIVERHEPKTIKERSKRDAQRALGTGKGQASVWLRPEDKLLSLPARLEKLAGEYYVKDASIATMLITMKQAMQQSVKKLDFERAAALRDRIKQLQEIELLECA